MNPFSSQLLNVVAYPRSPGAILCLLLPKTDPDSSRRPRRSWRVDLLASLPLWFSGGPPSVRLPVRLRRSLDSSLVRSIVGVDGISMLLVLLTTVLRILATSRVVRSPSAQPVLRVPADPPDGMVGIFVSLDTFLFYVFWESMLIPMYS
jgi:NADH-quinone oxidoreductase subunit M